VDFYRKVREGRKEKQTLPLMNADDTDQVDSNWIVVRKSNPLFLGDLSFFAVSPSLR
jgi:hypothetical protein